MSTAFEQRNTPNEPLETADETHELTAWFADPQKQANEPMPPLSPLSQRRLNGLVAGDHEFGFKIAMTNLHDIVDERQRQVVYLYMCGYSDSDLSLIAPDVPLEDIETIVEGWSEPLAEPAELHIVHDKPEITRKQPVEPRVKRELGHTAAAKTTKVKKPQKQPVEDPYPAFEFDDVGESDEKKTDMYVDELDRPAPAADLVRVYLDRIGKTALLNAEQEVELAKRIEAGLYAQQILKASELGEAIDNVTPREMTRGELRDLRFVARDGNRAREHMLEANLRLVVSLAKRYTGRGMPFLDIIQEGNLGLIRAMEKFDYALGFKFSTYATGWIRQAITRGLADQARTIRLPVHVVEVINKVSRGKREMTQTLGREPTIEELAREFDMKPEKLEEVLAFSREPVSLDQPVGDEDTTLGDLVADNRKNEIDESDLADRDSKIAQAVALLPAEVQWMARLRFGMVDGDAKTLDDIGERYGLTRERIRQKLNKEVGPRLRVIMSQMGLDQYAETAIDGQKSTLHEDVLHAIQGLKDRKQRECITAWLGLLDGRPWSDEEIAVGYRMTTRKVTLAIAAARRHLEKTLPKEANLYGNI